MDTDKNGLSSIRMLRRSVIRDRPVTYALGAVLSLHLSFRSEVIRKVVLECAKFWPKSPMYHHSTTLKLVISGHSFRYFLSLLFFLLHFCIFYLFPPWKLIVGVKVVLRRLLLVTDVSTS